MGEYKELALSFCVLFFSCYLAVVIFRTYTKSYFLTSFLIISQVFLMFVFACSFLDFLFLLKNVILK